MVSGTLDDSGGSVTRTVVIENRASNGVHESAGLHCFDFDGHLIRKHDFKRLQSGPYDAPELAWGLPVSRSSALVTARWLDTT